MTELDNARALARAETAALERAVINASAPDARRVLDNERVELMAAVQTRTTADSLRERIAEARRVREMWAGL